MEPSNTSKKDTAPHPAPRLVLITAEGPDTSKLAQNQIIGSKQRVAGSGGFCLTDR